MHGLKRDERVPKWIAFFGSSKISFYDFLCLFYGFYSLSIVFIWYIYSFYDLFCLFYRCYNLSMIFYASSMVSILCLWFLYDISIIYICPRIIIAFLHDLTVRFHVLWFNFDCFFVGSFQGEKIKPLRTISPSSTEFQIKIEDLQCCANDEL